MRKYLAMYKISLQHAFAYRGASILYRLGGLLGLITFASLWLSSESTGLIGGMTKPELTTYYLLGVFITSFVFWYPTEGIQDEINKGTLSLKYLLKPISYYASKFAQDSAWHTISPIFGLGMLAIGAFLFRDFMVLPESLTIIPPLLLALVLAAILFFNIAYFIGLLSFFTAHIEAVGSVLWLCIAIFGGEAIPLSFFPESAQPLLNLLPFRYIFSFPLEIYFGLVSKQEIIWGFGIAIFWIASFYFINIFNLENFFDNIIGVGRFPAQIFGNGLFFVFTLIIPVAFLATFPTQFLVGKGSFNLILIGLVLCAVFFALSQWFWNFALKRYSSASS